MIEVSGLTAGYGNKQVISRFSFFLEASQSPLVLAGSNGSGKSTLLRCLLNQISYQGAIQMPSDPNGIAWLPQGYSLPIDIPVSDFVALAGLHPSRPWSQPGKAETDRAVAQLKELEMDHLAFKRTDELSGGEWQMVCLAQMAMQGSEIWLLDEPTAHLDLYFKNLVFHYLWKKSAEGKCIILSTHDIPFLPEKGGKFLLMDNQTMPDINPETKKMVADRLRSGQKTNQVSDRTVF